jgi:hypothetical protein
LPSSRSRCAERRRKGPNEMAGSPMVRPPSSPFLLPNLPGEAKDGPRRSQSRCCFGDAKAFADA